MPTTPAASSASATSSVCGPGPSSNVSATVFPFPGARVRDSPVLGGHASGVATGVGVALAVGSTGAEGVADAVGEGTSGVGEGVALTEAEGVPVVGIAGVDPAGGVVAHPARRSAAPTRAAARTRCRGERLVMGPIVARAVEYWPP